MNTKKAAEMCCFFKNICDIIVTTKKNGGLRQCHNCGRMYEEIITYRKYGHVDVYQNPANGRWTCYECGYQIY